MKKKLLDLNTDWTQARPHITHLANSVTIGGYQHYEINSSLDVTPLNEDLKIKDSLICRHLQNVAGKSILDLGCAGGYFAIKLLQQKPKSVDLVDIDVGYIALLQDIREYINKVTKSSVPLEIHNMRIAQYQDNADVTFALALIHWIYNCSDRFASLFSAVSFLRGLTKEVLFVEWVDGEDPAIKILGHLTRAGDDPGTYTEKNFREALDLQFDKKVSIIGNLSSTRRLYKCVV